MEASDWPREGMNRPIAAASQWHPSPLNKIDQVGMRLDLECLYGNNRTPAHSFPARNDKLVIPESF